MTFIKFDQGNINKLNLTEINNLNKKATDINHTLILSGYIKCNECGGTTPLDMFVDENWTACSCIFKDSMEEL